MMSSVEKARAKSRRHKHHNKTTQQIYSSHERAKQHQTHLGVSRHQCCSRRLISTPQASGQLTFAYHPFWYTGTLTSKDILEINNLVVSQWFIDPH